MKLLRSSKPSELNSFKKRTGMILFILFVAFSFSCIQSCKSDEPNGSEEIKNEAPKSEEIEELVNSWAKAWEEAPFSIDLYKSFYHPSFKADYKSRSGMDYVDWLSDKKAKAKKAKCIEVYLSDLAVEFREDVAIASFMQRYVSRVYCDSGMKKLFFKKFDDGWKIVGEEQPSITTCSDRCR